MPDLVLLSCNSGDGKQMVEVVNRLDRYHVFGELPTDDGMGDGREREREFSLVFLIF